MTWRAEAVARWSMSLILISAHPLTAQDPEAFPYGDEAEETEAPRIRVTAVRPARVDLVSPGDATYLSADAIERSQASSVPELLAREANILFRGSTGKASEGQIAMRGFGENSGLRVRIEVDGHTFNRPDMGMLDWTQIPIHQVSHIEILRGGHTVRYGNHAMAGVVKITTKKGGEPRLYLRGVHGSHGFEHYSVDGSTGIGEWYGDAGAGYMRDPGFRDHSLSWAKSLHGSVGRFIGDEGTLTVRASQSQTYMQFPGPLSRSEMENNPRQSNSLGDQYAFATNTLVTAVWEGDHAWGKSGMNAGYSQRNMHWSLGGTLANNDQQGLSVSPFVQLGDDVSFLLVGSDIAFDRVEFERRPPPPDGRLLSDAQLDRLTTGPYVYAQRGLPKNLTFGAGARAERSRTKHTYFEYDHINPTAPAFIPAPWGGFMPNPAYDPNAPLQQVINHDKSYRGPVSKQGWAAELSLSWAPRDDVSLWSRYSRVYRYPALDETAAYQGYPLSDPLNRNLDPEEGNNFETGIKVHGERFLFSGTLFCLLLNNEIAFDPQQNLNVNIGSTQRLGAESEVGFDAGFWGATTRWTWIDARFTEGPNKNRTVPLAPRLHGTTSLWIEPHPGVRLTGFHSHIASQYQGSDEANQLQKIESSGLFGARIDLRPTQKIGLFLKVDNLFDETYASSAYSGAWYPGPGRTIQVGITMEL